MGKTPKGQTRNKILQFVRQQLMAGHSPSLRDIQQAFGFKAIETVREHLEVLVSANQLDKISGISRGFRLPHHHDTREPNRLIPLIGQVQAGPLQLAIEHPSQMLAIQSRYPADELFALTVQGESMLNKAILPGDIVVVHRQPTADSGDIVVALVDDEATVKTLRIRRGRLELHPENPVFKPIIPKPDSLTILGKVIEVRRYLEDQP